MFKWDAISLELFRNYKCSFHKLHITNLEKSTLDTSSSSSQREREREREKQFWVGIFLCGYHYKYLKNWSWKFSKNIIFKVAIPCKLNNMQQEKNHILTNLYNLIFFKIMSMSYKWKYKQHKLNDKSDRKEKRISMSKLKHACFKSLLNSALEISEDPPTKLPLT